MNHRSAAMSLAEVSVASGISVMIILIVMTASLAISKFTQQAVTIRIADIQTSQGTEAVTKELRDGTAVLASATIAGQTFTTSSSCVVFAASSYDFTKANPLIDSTDTIAFSFSLPKSQVSRSCMVASGSRRPGGLNLKVMPCTDARFTYRVSEVVDWLSTSTSTVTQTYRLSAIPLEPPVCTRNGSSIPCTWQAGSQSVTIQTPPGASMFGIQYKVNPTSTSCPYITSVELAVTKTLPSINTPESTISHVTEARLRNKR